MEEDTTLNELKTYGLSNGAKQCLTLGPLGDYETLLLLNEFDLILLYTER